MNPDVAAGIHSVFPGQEDLIKIWIRNIQRQVKGTLPIASHNIIFSFRRFIVALFYFLSERTPPQGHAISFQRSVARIESHFSLSLQNDDLGHRISCINRNLRPVSPCKRPSYNDRTANQYAPKAKSAMDEHPVVSIRDGPSRKRKSKSPGAGRFHSTTWRGAERGRRGWRDLPRRSGRCR